MTTFPRSPQIQKGALIGIDPAGPIASAAVFQYNPDTLTRRLEARAVNQEGDRGEAFRLTGPPKETLTLNVEIDAADQLEKSVPGVLAKGLHPVLAALEMMLYPASASVIANDAQAARGTIEIIPAEAPLTLFVWGPSRVVPVRLTSFSITEEAYDTQLNPIRAKVELSLNVLSYHDLQVGSYGYSVYRTHHIAQEVMAKTNIRDSGAARIRASLQF